MPKIDRAHKNYLTPEIWEETHLREIFYGTLIFQQSSMICIGRHVGGDTLALQLGRQNYFLLLSCKMFDSYAQMYWKCFHVIFSTISLKFKCKISVLKEVIHSFKNQFGHVTTCELTHFKKMVQVWKTKSQLFCLKYDPLMVFWSQNHITFFAQKWCHMTS